MRRLLGMLAIGLLGTLAAITGCSDDNVGSNTADSVVINARILTCDDQKSTAEAMAIKGSKIVFVGSNEKVADFIGTNTLVMDADGRTLTPGFIDNHTHFFWMAILRPIIVDLYECKNIDEVNEKVLAYAKANPDLPLILGFGWRYEQIPGGIPEQSVLDEWLPDRQVWLLSYDACTLWTNTKTNNLMLEKNPKACERMIPQIDEETGKPTGIYLSSNSFDPFDFFALEDFGLEIKRQMLAEVDRAVQEVLKMGVTACDDLQLYKSVLPIMIEYRDTGGFDNIRVRGAYYVDPIDIKDEQQLIADLVWWKDIGTQFSDGRLKLGTAVKTYIDGVSGNHTAFMTQPYSDAPDKFGFPNWTQEEFDRLIQIMDDLELQACIHAVGDAGIVYILNSIERSMNRSKKWDSRHRIEHCELPSKEDMERMVQLGVYASMQPAQFFGDESVEKALGPERLKRIDPWRSLQEAGVEISFGTDYISGPLPPVNPIYGLIIAATRINYKGDTDWGEEEKIELIDAIQHYTLGSARALKMDDIIGSIEVGKEADFVIFNTDLLDMTSVEFLSTHEIAPGKLDDFVDLTVVRGKQVYVRDGATF